MSRWGTHRMSNRLGRYCKSQGIRMRTSSDDRERYAPYYAVHAVKALVFKSGSDRLVLNDQTVGEGHLIYKLLACTILFREYRSDMSDDTDQSRIQIRRQPPATHTKNMGSMYHVLQETKRTTRSPVGIVVLVSTNGCPAPTQVFELPVSIRSSTIVNSVLQHL